MYVCMYVCMYVHDITQQVMFSVCFVGGTASGFFTVEDDVRVVEIVLQ